MLPLPRFVSARTGMELNGKKLARGDTSHGDWIDLSSTNQMFRRNKSLVAQQIFRIRVP